MKSFSFLLIIVLLNLAVTVLCADKYSRYDFPPGFVFGSATTAYQVVWLLDSIYLFNRNCYSLLWSMFTLYTLDMVIEHWLWIKSYTVLKRQLILVMENDKLLITYGRWREQQAKMGGLLAFGILLPTLVSFFSYSVALLFNNLPQ